MSVVGDAETRRSWVAILRSVVKAHRVTLENDDYFVKAPSRIIASDSIFEGDYTYRKPVFCQMWLSMSNDTISVMQCERYDSFADVISL